MTRRWTSCRGHYTIYHTENSRGTHKGSADIAELQNPNLQTYLHGVVTWYIFLLQWYQDSSFWPKSLAQVTIWPKFPSNILYHVLGGRRSYVIFSCHSLPFTTHSSIWHTHTASWTLFSWIFLIVSWGRNILPFFFSIPYSLFHCKLISPMWKQIRKQLISKLKELLHS